MKWRLGQRLKAGLGFWGRCNTLRTILTEWLLGQRLEAGFRTLASGFSMYAGQERLLGSLQSLLMSPKLVHKEPLPFWSSLGLIRRG